MAEVTLLLRSTAMPQIRPKPVRELLALLKRKYGRHDDKIAAPPPLPAPPRSRLSPLRWLILAALAAKVLGAMMPDQVRWGLSERAIADHQEGKPMPDDVKAKVRALLREHPDERAYIFAELRWKGWLVNGL
jgi:hypothetical protein